MPAIGFSLCLFAGLGKTRKLIYTMEGCSGGEEGSQYILGQILTSHVIGLAVNTNCVGTLRVSRCSLPF